MSEADSKFADSLISQEALDELMKEAEELSLEQPVIEEDSTDLDLVSPEDIAKLLETSSGIKADDQDESDLDLISQDDIDSLIAGEELSGSGSTATEDSDDSLISQDDIDALLGEAGTSEKSEEAENTEDSDDSLISQSDIDALLGGAGTSEESDDAENTEDSDDSLISQDDIDALLNGGAAASDENVITDDTDTSLISQEDIDSLLNDVGSEEENEDGAFVTQDDIEDLLGNDEDDSPVDAAITATGEKLVSQEDIDKLLNADADDIDDTDDEVIGAVVDQVILEKGDEKKDSEKNEKKKWLSSKKIIGCAVGIVLLIVTGFSIAIFSGSPEKDIVETEIVESSEEVVVAELEEEMVQPDDFADAVYITVELKDFVVPAPLAMKNISYISLDLTLEIADVTSDPIKGYEPFFRNVIYEVLNKALELQSESRIIEADLIRMLQNALNDALSEGSVSKVSFMEFNIT